MRSALQQFLSLPQFLLPKVIQLARRKDLLARSAAKRREACVISAAGGVNILFWPDDTLTRRTTILYLVLIGQEEDSAPK